MTTENNLWIPVDEMLPVPYQLVMVWTDYQPRPYFNQKGPDGTPKRAWISFTFTTGFVDETDDWNIQVMGSLRRQNYNALHPMQMWVGITPFNVTHWMPMPPAPPGHSYPPFRQGVSPRGQQLPATEARV